MDFDWKRIIELLITALAGGILSFILQLRKDNWQFFREKKQLPQQSIDSGIKASGEALAVIRQYTEELGRMRKDVQDLYTEVTMLRNELAEKEQQIDEWKNGISRLIAQLVSLGYTPVWEPKTQPIKPLT